MSEPTKTDISRGIAALRSGMSEYGYTGKLYVAYAGFWWENGKIIGRIPEIEEWDNQQETTTGTSDGD